MYLRSFCLQFVIQEGVDFFSEDGKSQWFIWRVLIISVLWFDAEKKKKEKEEEAQQELYFVTVYP